MQSIETKIVLIENDLTIMVKEMRDMCRVVEAIEKKIDALLKRVEVSDGK